MREGRRGRIFSPRLCRLCVHVDILFVFVELFELCRCDGTNRSELAIEIREVIESHFDGDLRDAEIVLL